MANALKLYFHGESQLKCNTYMSCTALAFFPYRKLDTLKIERQPFFIRKAIKNLTIVKSIVPQKQQPLDRIRDNVNDDFLHATNRRASYG